MYLYPLSLSVHTGLCGARLGPLLSFLALALLVCTPIVKHRPRCACCTLRRCSTVSNCREAAVVMPGRSARQVVCPGARVPSITTVSSDMLIAEASNHSMLPLNSIRGANELLCYGVCRARSFHQDRMKATQLSAQLPHLSVDCIDVTSDEFITSIAMLRACSFYVVPAERSFAGALLWSIRRRVLFGHELC